MDDKTIKILFVCSGNVCRSPMAQAIFAKKAKEAGFEDVFESSSAGMSDTHEGDPCDPRAVLTCRRRDVQLVGHQARRIQPDDFVKYDLILAMDWEVLTELQQRAPAECQHKIQLMMRYANEFDEAIVPDPYFGVNEGFVQAFEYCSDACEGLLEYYEKKAKQLKAERAAAAAKH
ncbi:low molecular weight protein-tyrosine-phosphatase [Sutterella sp.]|uniref:low molecular weight protein-tyrosine-phosphatase n=1 Tax=Sutterella sp. TaxID=1981025 RepID=UPI0026DF1AF8|nr:low molecular weight protein-tyrosine-phosphatase [Sutterella sp.]MDO5530508.1 low molecular weight protein-tyrosine-phosphatase [Sutterella sp.]